MKTTTTKKLGWVLPRLAVLLSIAVAYGTYGCATQPEEEEETPDQTQDELSFRRGSVDHAAIVESTTMMLAGGPFDSHLDPYNQEDPFAIRGSSYADVFKTRLGQFDAYDNTTDWKPEHATKWAARMSSGNYQIIDTSKPCDFNSPHSYLEIERSNMLGRDHVTCGGRNPNEDALDVTINFLVRGPQASVTDENAIHDGVEQATKKASDTFPYLGDMNGWL